MKTKLLIAVLLCCCAVHAWVYHPAYFARFDLEAAYIYPPGHTYQGRLADNGYTVDNVREGTGQFPVLVTSPVYADSYALKFDAPASTAVKDRTEYNHLNGLPFYYNSYTAFAIFVPTNVANPSTWQIMYQWHQFSPNGPPMSLDFMSNGNYSLVLRNDDDSYEQIYTESLPRGVWVRFMFQHYFGLDGDGYVKMWVNDVLKIDYSGTIGWYSPEDDYLINTKFGIYRGGPASACTIYFDEIRVGTRYSEVKIP